MAQEKYRFFNSSTGDVRSYDASDMAAALRTLALDGVGALDDTCLKVSAEGATMRTLVGYGTAYVQGYHYELRDDGGGIKAFTHATTADLDRIDRIVLRLDLTARTIILAKKVGTPGATPEPPALTRTSDIYELAIAQVYVRTGATEVLATDVTDERADETVCGVAAPEGVKLSTLWQRLLTFVSGAEDKKLIARQTMGALGADDIVNTLTSTETAKALSAAQGQALKTQVDACVLISSIINALTSDSVDVPLSAAQGKALKALVDTRVTIASIVNALTSDDATVPLSAAQGKALKTALDLKMSATLLWTNASPTSTFVPQTISLDLSAYDAVFIDARLASGEPTAMGLLLIRKGSIGLLSMARDVTYYRTITLVSNTGVQFDAGHVVSPYGTAATSNTYMVPTHIYGLNKGVL